MKRNLIIFGSVALLGVGAFMFFRKKPEELNGNDESQSNGKDESQTNNTNVVETIVNPVKNVVNSVIDLIKTDLKFTSYPLKLGSKNSIQVKNLQKWLNDNGYSSNKLVEDGNFGNLTQVAVINMQDNPSTKAIQDYLGDMQYLDNIVNKFSLKKSFEKGVVSYDFYHFFIVKSKIYIPLSLQNKNTFI